MKKVIILGSTGSIGTQAVEVALKYPDKYQVVALSTNKNASLVLQQAAKLSCENVLISDIEIADKAAHEAPGNLKLYKGTNQIESFLDIEADLVLNALVGSVGLEATLKVLKNNSKLALANKESLVVGGDIINKHYRDRKANIIPVDSEHSAIYQLLQGENKEEVRNIIITASGGPFRKASLDEMRKATPEEALAHPRWKMGPKITIDSATLVNKGLEVMEAHYLFDMSYENIKVVMHPQSIIHSMVEFIDGSVKAHLGPTDMRIPIQYALSYPERLPSPAGYTDFVQGEKLTFEQVDYTKFKALKLAYEAGQKKQGYPVVFNGANEVAVAAFLGNKINLLKIVEIIEQVMERHKARKADDLDTVKALDAWSKNKAREQIGIK